MKPTIPKTIARFAGAALFAAATVWSARADYSSTVLSHSPLAYWQLNETTPSPALNLLTNKGSVGTAGNGVIVRDAVAAQPGKVGNSITLNNTGAGSIDVLGKVDVPFNAALNPKAPFSIELWAYPRRNDETLCALSSMNCQYNGGGSRLGWLIYENASVNWQFRLGLISGYAVILSSSAAPVVNSWQHIVATFDGTTAKIYVNGVLSGSGAVAAGWAPNTQMPLMFGALPLDGAGGNSIDGPACSFGGIAGYRGFDGGLDEVAIYPSVLSASAVAAHYAAAATPATYDATILADSPLGYWNCDDPAVAAPDPNTLPVVTNLGSVGSALNGTNMWGDLAAQSGAGYAGLGSSANKACFFDGDNGYVALGDDPAMHFSGQITMMAWVKPTSVNYFRNIIGHGWDGNYMETFLRLSQGDDGGGGSDGNNYYEAGCSFDGTEAGYDDNVARYQIPAGDVGNWVFIAATYDGSAWNLYRDGQLVAQTVTPNGAVDVTNRWSIGSRTSPSPTTGYQSATFESEGLFFNGYIDEPAIFSSALSGPDILALYRSAQVPPVITQALVNPGTVSKFSTVNFSVVADGDPTLGYMWTSNGVPTGNTTTTYSIPNIGNGTYTIDVIVTNLYGTNISSVTFSAVPNPPSIVSAPTGLTRFVGAPFSFSVSGAGTPPITYYWLLGSTVVQAGPSSTYSGIASLANAGSYSVILSNETTINLTSAPVALNVNPAPAPTSYPGAVIGSGPLSYWRLDEASGSIAYDTVGTNNGVYNSVLLGLTGYSVLDSDTAAGFSGINSYVGSISGTAINFTNNANFTLEAWVNAPDGLPDQSTIIAKGIGANNTTHTEQFALDVSGGSYRFFTTRGTPTYQATASTGPNGTWQHVVGVYDGQNALGGGVKLYIYVNGLLEGSANCPTTGQNPTTTQVSIGSKRTGNDPNYDGTFGGTIDEVAVYGYALSSSDVYNHYKAAYGTTLAPVILIEPVPTTNYLGLPVTISVVDYGSQPLTYQWFQGSTPVGVNSSTYSVATVGFGDQGNYHVNISNGINTTNSVTVPLVVLPPPTTPPAIPGLVMHLPLNSNLTDVTGRGNDGTGFHSTWNTVTGTTNTSTPNVSNPSFFYTDSPFPGTNALHFSTMATNGSVKALDTYYVKIGVKPDLQFGSNINFTVSYWIRTPQDYGGPPSDQPYGGGDLPFFTTSVGSLGGFGYDFATAYAFGTQSPPAVGSAAETLAHSVDGTWCLSLYGTGALGFGLHGIQGEGTGSINDGSWHNLIHVVNRQTSIVTTYLDGIPVKSALDRGTSLSVAGSIDSGNPATIGQDPTGLYGELGSADICDLGVWRKALTPLEASSIYSAAYNNQLSYAYVPITFTSSHTASNITLSWSLGTLQSATSVGGPYTDVSSGSPYTTSSTTGNQFFRVRYTYQ
jgi:hypothetical protein